MDQDKTHAQGDWITCQQNGLGKLPQTRSAINTGRTDAAMDYVQFKSENDNSPVAVDLAKCNAIGFG